MCHSTGLSWVRSGNGPLMLRVARIVSLLQTSASDSTLEQGLNPANGPAGLECKERHGLSMADIALVVRARARSRTVHTSQRTASIYERSKGRWCAEGFIQLSHGDSRARSCVPQRRQADFYAEAREPTHATKCRTAFLPTTRLGGRPTCRLHHSFLAHHAPT